MPHETPRSKIGVWTVAAVMLALVACYRPKIVDGGLRCGPAIAKRCPDGFRCDPISNSCTKMPVSDSAPIDLPIDRGDQPDLATDPGSDRGEVVCLAPRPDCAAQDPSALCDPFCRSGCGCSKRCSVNSVGALTCNAPLNGDLQVGRSCDILSSGTPVQSDGCAPGLVCLREGCGMHCFQFCRTNADCPQSSCSRAAAPAVNPIGFKVCEVAFSACNPLNALAGGCSLAGQTCYLSPVVPDKAFCDCPAGDKRASEACVAVQDCVPGLTCVDATNTGDLRCRATCDLTAANSCDGGASCRPINGSKMFGFCS